MGVLENLFKCPIFKEPWYYETGPFPEVLKLLSNTLIVQPKLDIRIYQYLETSAPGCLNSKEKTESALFLTGHKQGGRLIIPEVSS